MSQTIKASEADIVPLPPRPEPPPLDPFHSLPDHLRAEMRALLAPIQAAGLPMELDPVVPHTVATLIDGRMYRVSTLSSRDGIPTRVAVLGPMLEEVDRGVFLDLIPKNPDAAVMPLISAGLARTPGRSQADILEAILDELRAIRAALGA